LTRPATKRLDGVTLKTVSDFSKLLSIAKDEKKSVLASSSKNMNNRFHKTSNAFNLKSQRKTDEIGCNSLFSSQNDDFTV